jgi:hypothetical protein
MIDTPKRLKKIIWVYGRIFPDLIADLKKRLATLFSVSSGSNGNIRQFAELVRLRHEGAAS